jgi:hypothetical protein
VDRPTPLSSDGVLGLLHALHFGAQHGYLDPGAHNEAGQGYFVCGGPGLEQRISVQVRGALVYGRGWASQWIVGCLFGLHHRGNAYCTLAGGCVSVSPAGTRL